MPRFLAARQEAEEQERASRSAAKQMLAERRLSGFGATPREQYASAGTSILGIGFSGRMGQMSYLAGTLVYAALMMWIVVSALKMQGFAPALAGLPVLLFLNLRLTILRLHDIGVTGWWWLTSFVPVANLALTVVLYAVPGSPEDKGYGLPSRGSNLIGVLVAALFCAVSTAGFVDALRPALPALAAAYLGNVTETTGYDGDPSGTSGSGSAGYHPSANSVVMYSLSTCPYCAQKRRELDAAGIRYTEFFIDENEQAAARLNEKLDRAGLPPRSYGVPILDVNGNILPNNPSMNEIVRHLRRRTT